MTQIALTLSPGLPRLRLPDYCSWTLEKWRLDLGVQFASEVGVIGISDVG